MDIEWNSAKKYSYATKGLKRLKTSGICHICNNKTYVYDIDFEVYIHPKCQITLINKYVKECE